MNPQTPTPPLAQKKDILLVILFLLVTVLLGSFLFSSHKGDTATVRIDGEIAATLSLKKNGEYTFENQGHTLILLVEQGGIRVQSSTCPDRICMNTGLLKNQGAAAVCLPAGISVTVEGQPLYDGITY
ncbi:MAG: NusG domain II-containing protein [Clostridia bacterium]|nr:NusG domain II-containing protein [Clostridia bacterium]